MKKAKYLLLLGAGLAALALAGCMFIPAAPTGYIEGYVVDAGAGAPVVGAKVTAWIQDGQSPIYQVSSGYFTPFATTDADGFYRLVVPEGVYTVVVEKEGYGTSKVEGVRVGSTAKLDIVEKPLFNPAWPAEPPEVTLTGVEEGGTYSAPISFRVDAQGPNDIKYIYVALGKTPGSSYLTAPRQIYQATYTTGDQTIDPADFGVEGDTTFEVVVYDVNENRTHLIRHIYVEPSAGGGPIQPPAGLAALAVTLSKRVGFYKGPITVPSGAGDISIQAAPAGANLYVELSWDASPDDASITGYRIYRRLQGEADFSLVGTVAADGSASYAFRDPSPALQVGVEATYQVRAYVGSTESEAVEASTTPLGTWDVELLEPADGATDVSLTPTFRWRPTAEVGSDQYYLWVLWDLACGAPYLVPVEFLNQTEFEYEDLGIAGDPYERLQPHRVYQWYIGEAVAYDDFVNPTAISIAVNDMSWLTGNPHVGIPATDLFTFTTGDW